MTGSNCLFVTALLKTLKKDDSYLSCMRALDNSIFSISLKNPPPLTSHQLTTEEICRSELDLKISLKVSWGSTGLNKTSLTGCSEQDHLTPPGSSRLSLAVTGGQQTMSEFVSGWIGGCCGLLIGHPFDTLKVRQQNSPGQARISVTIRNCLRQVK